MRPVLLAAFARPSLTSPTIRNTSQCRPSGSWTGVFGKRCTSSRAIRSPSKCPSTARPLSAPRSTARNAVSTAIRSAGHVSKLSDRRPRSPSCEPLPLASRSRPLRRIGHGSHKREGGLGRVHPGALDRDRNARFDPDRVRHATRDLDLVHAVRPYVPGALRRDDYRHVLYRLPVLEVERDREPRLLFGGIEHADGLVTLL